MGSPSELTLDYKPAPPTYRSIQNDQQTHDKLEDFLARLEEERHKINAFKRELPLCMQLLNNAMETYKKQLEAYQTNQEPKPVLEEFIPVSNMSINAPEKSPVVTVQSEKANWMVSAQLWSPSSADNNNNNNSMEKQTKLELDSKQRNGGAFLPFSKKRGNGGSLVPELGLGSPTVENKCLESDGNTSKSMTVFQEQQPKGGSSTSIGNNNEGNHGGHRKARRCWSPDLHKRFVNALQKLGGSQVATPKQIRELMKVDGLTNDEVKSHLQKYRLHTRRPIQPPQPASTSAPQLLVLGGIWVPPEYATSAGTNTVCPTIYGTSHPGGTHYSFPHHDYYASPPQHHLHCPAVTSMAPTAYKAQVRSPSSELRSSGARSESFEESEGNEEDEDQEEEEECDYENDKAIVPLVNNN